MKRRGWLITGALVVAATGALYIAPGSDYESPTYPSQQLTTTAAHGSIDDCELDDTCSMFTEVVTKP